MLFRSMFFALLILFSGVFSASAQFSFCAQRIFIIQGLKERREERVGVGLDAGQNVFELYISPHTGSWSVVTTFPSGQSCILATGYDWEQFEITTDEKI